VLERDGRGATAERRPPGHARAAHCLSCRQDHRIQRRALLFLGTNRRRGTPAVWLRRTDLDFGRCRPRSESGARRFHGFGQYRAADWIMTFATYSHGEKSAGLNLANLALSVPKIVAPESVDNYEIGFKSSVPDGRVTFNADAFWANDTNYQTTLLDTTRFVIYL